MIRKIARVEAPPEVAMEVFRDTDAWPRWMPAVASTRTLDTGVDFRLVEVVLLVMGRRLVQHLECREQGDRLVHQQVLGWFREWRAEWTFQPSAAGRGVIVSLALDIDLGVAGRLLPRRLVSRWVHGWIDRAIARGCERARELARGRREPPGPVPEGQPLLRVYRTAEGFEVHFAGRMFTIAAQEPFERDFK